MPEAPYRRRCRNTAQKACSVRSVTGSTAMSVRPGIPGLPRGNSMSVVKNENGRPILRAMVKAIRENKQYLGDMDCLTGDQGMNIKKGFALYGEQLGNDETSFSDGLYNLGTVLLNKTGGTMAPIYGIIFMEMSDKADDAEEITLELFGEMLQAGLDGVYGIVDVRPGDKTLVDTLFPACEYIKAAAAAGKDYAEALDQMKEKAEAGRELARKLIAKHGRAAILGERSRGIPDVGAAVCCIILKAMADGMKSVLEA